MSITNIEVNLTVSYYNFNGRFVFSKNKRKIKIYDYDLKKSRVYENVTDLVYVAGNLFLYFEK